MELAANEIRNKLSRAAVAACLRDLDVRLLDAVRDDGVVLETANERLVYVAVLALGARTALLLHRSGHPALRALGGVVAARPTVLGFILMRAFGAHVLQLLADPDGDVVLERLARFVREGKGLDG